MAIGQGPVSVGPKKREATFLMPVGRAASWWCCLPLGCRFGVGRTGCCPGSCLRFGSVKFTIWWDLNCIYGKYLNYQSFLFEVRIEGSCTTPLFLPPSSFTKKERNSYSLCRKFLPFTLSPPAGGRGPGWGESEKTFGNRYNTTGDRTCSP
jgi:hypothetical protein